MGLFFMFLKDSVEKILSATIVDSQAVSGGCVSEAYLVTTSKQQNYVVKLDQSRCGMLMVEADGLQQLKQTDTFYIPTVISVDEHLLILEAIAVTNPQKYFWQIFGEKLAALHQFTGEHWGLSYDNYIGMTPQLNSTKENSWSDFFVNQRIAPQFKWLKEKGLATGRLSEIYNDLIKTIIAHLTRRVPSKSLLHGDLWSGNYLVSPNNSPVLIDPAIYYGDREAEFSMMLLFGGFPAEMFDAYQNTWPMDEGWEQRRSIYKLYHLMNHANLFGQSYIAQVQQCTDQIIRLS
ncbi:MAG: fructosamine kinase [Zetaproteobacteria bacterium]|nr:fructosamine kinase [Pseudobdellovibrionaceae bacterium]